MRMLRSSLFAALAVFACAFVITPAIAAAPVSYPAYDQIHQELKSKPAGIATVADDHAIHRCKMPVVHVSTVLGRGIHSARSYGPVLHIAHRLPSVEFFRRC